MIFFWQNKREDKFKTLKEFKEMQSLCEFGSFQFNMFEKAINLINEGKNVKTVKNWVGNLEKEWNKF